MDIKICTCCGKVICESGHCCKTCGANYCQNCHKMCGEHCRYCGEGD